MSIRPCHSTAMTFHHTYLQNQTLTWTLPASHSPSSIHFGVQFLRALSCVLREGLGASTMSLPLHERAGSFPLFRSQLKCSPSKRKRSLSALLVAVSSCHLPPHFITSVEIYYGKCCELSKKCLL